MNQLSLSEQPLRSFAKEILRYLTDHPEAADTVQGIVQWWLHRAWVEGATKDTQIALGVLVRKGWITETEIPAPKIYRINEARLAEIREFLASSTEP